MKYCFSKIERQLCMVLMIIFCIIICFILGFYESLRVLTHLIYIPITLATIWWGNKGISVAAFFGILMIIISLIFETAPPLHRSLLMAVTFIIVGYLVGRLSGERELEHDLSRLKDKVIKESNRKNKK
ncbi:MAG: hypothetical protein KAJ14_06665 [Candidatus Omnitrophica bacterium]|nr:hypothetical protein [Candidatus Omnitrophota bacterium]MCK5630190.1 hypothetical protein [Nanoarchaeota archaeon]